MSLAITLIALLQGAPAIELSPCTLPELDTPARCGVLDVPENPDEPNGRQLSIAIAVVPATSGKSRPDPIVPLMGGPGEHAISAGGYFAQRFADLLKDRDLLLIDQRGAGRSAALVCDLFPAEHPDAAIRDFFPPAAAETCASTLSARADLTRYTYPYFANDLEAVRRALGYGPLNLFAGSYGTRAAQVYVRAYPQSVRTVYMGSAVPIDVATPLTFARTTDPVLERTLSACAWEPECRRAFPNLLAEFREIVKRLDSGRVRVRVPGVDGTVPLSRGRFMEFLRGRLYRPSSAAVVPSLVHRAHAGDWSPVVESMLTGARNASAELSFGLLFAITCSEDVPFMSEVEIVARTRGTFLGDYRPRQQQAACRSWPQAALPPDYRKPVRSDVPALFVSGDTDSASPLWFTERVAPGFSRRAEVVVAGHGHTEWNDCTARLFEQLVRSGGVEKLEGATCPPVSRPPFQTGP